ncbi:TPA: radical SAM protein [Candidatus Woesearchaeota archaeon]|nr:radical SAM protein [Candidatus Woesearchaeota archaeon]
MKITKTSYFSYRLKGLPKGCQQCVRGEKLVLFVTGVCPRRCYYCPISDQKSQKDVTYANERPVTDHSARQITEEARLCGSKGAGFTGGDPLARLDRTINYIKTLKKAFGKRFHIHLYTSLNLVTPAVLKRLHEAGLDEIRFHPDLDNDQLWEKIVLAKGLGWDVGVEIPAIPGKLRETKRLMEFLDGKIKFLNINELELSDGKASSLSELGYMSKDYLSYGVKGSDNMAKELLKHALKKRLRYSVHYCTAKLKDKVQLANRIKRRGKNVKKKYDVLTSEGLLQRGAIYGKNLAGVRRWLVSDIGVPADLVETDKERQRLLTNAGVVMNLVDELKKKGMKPAIVTEYPTWDRLTIETDWL